MPDMTVVEPKNEYTPIIIIWSNALLKLENFTCMTHLIWNEYTPDLRDAQ
jgi:hypothetical protein